MPWILPLVLSAAALLLIVAYLRRLSLLRLVGPVFFYDLLRLSRRGRFVVLRVGYAALLFVLLALAHEDWAQRYGVRRGDGLFATVQVPLQHMSKLGESVFGMFMSAQFVAVFLITPLYMAGAVADEKERRTLELLFASGLTSREIVMGKLAARLGHVLAVILAGLPILVLLPFWGGVDPNLVLCGFVATAAAAVSVGSFGVWASIRARRPFDAALITYAGVFAYMLISPCIPGPGAWFTFSTFFGMAPGGVDLKEMVILLLIFVALHGVAAVVFTVSAIHQLRLVGFDADPEEPWKKSPLRPPPIVYYRRRPRAPIRPLRLAIWKERFVERSLLEDYPVLTGTLVVLFLGLGGPFVLVLLSLLIGGARHQESNAILRPLLVAFAAPAPLFVGLSAAWRISRERERYTLDSLLCTALEWRFWVLAKALVPFRNVSFLLGIVVMLCGVGVIAGGFNIITIPLLLAMETIHLCFAAALGLFLSARCSSTVRAMMLTLLLLLGLWFVPLYLGPASLLSPPVALWQLGVGYDYRVEEIPQILAAFAVPAAVYGLGTWLLWRGTLRSLHHKVSFQT
jgi:ABC-type transport system involved in multi-copper enzyme maturation permease subunit